MDHKAINLHLGKDFQNYLVPEETHQCAFYINACPATIRPVNPENVKKETDIKNKNNASQKSSKTMKEPQKGEEKVTENCNDKSCSTEEIKHEIDTQTEERVGLPVQDFHNALVNCHLVGRWKVLPTPSGIIVTFARKEDAQDIFEKIEIAKVLKGPVQVATLPQLFKKPDQQLNDILPHMNLNYDYSFSGKGQGYISGHNQKTIMGRSTSLLIRDVPWSIPLDDIRVALEMQGISINSLERWRQHVRLEVKRLGHGDYLQMEGFDFYGVSRFIVSTERGNHNYNSRDDHIHGQGDDVLQCYRCQGFWHLAVNCRQIPRCVRCGEAHGMEHCMRPRNNPMCCNCYGAHHAAYKGCPVRKEIGKSALISFTLSKYFPSSSSSTLPPSNNQQPRCIL